MFKKAALSSSFLLNWHVNNFNISRMEGYPYSYKSDNHLTQLIIEFIML